MARALFLDTAVLAYATGDEHPLRAACRDLLDQASRGEIDLHISVEALQELLFHRLRRGGRAEAIAVVRAVWAGCHSHPFDDDVATLMLDLTARTHLGGRDAVHAATALSRGFGAIVSPDRDFDGVAGLARLDPAELATR